MGRAIQLAAQRVPAIEVDEPESIPVDDECWQRPWLVDLLEVPAEATWPRFLTAPHPDAVGSYGELVEESALARAGVVLRWWQCLFMRMLLQHDADGDLLVEWAIKSTARQLGKSVGIQELGWWRMHAGSLFGERQELLHTARTFPPARDVLRPVAEAQECPGHPLARTANEWRFLWRLDGSTWLAIAHTAAYQRSASLALVDEAWGVPVASVTEGIEPTIVERASSQLVLASTAHRRATALVPGRRATALENLRTPTEGLICEWSAPRDADIGDPVTWRQASPHWSKRRERLIRARFEAAMRGEGADDKEPDPIESFRNQWLNQWPRRVALGGPGEDLVDLDLWRELVLDGLPDQTGPAVLAVEDFHGNGCGAVLVTECGPRLVAQCWTFDRRRDLFDWMAGTVGMPQVIAGVTLAEDPDLRAIEAGVVRHGTTETKPALALLREMVSARRVWHQADTALDAQISVCKVRNTTGGLMVCSKQRDDLVRCCAWAARYVDQGLADPGGIS